MKRVTNDTTKLAPYSIESEVALLGSVLIDPCVMESLCVIEPDDFFIIKNGWVWSALQRLYKSKEPIDFLMGVTRWIMMAISKRQAARHSSAA